MFRFKPQLRFRNFRKAFEIAIKHGLPEVEQQLYIGSTKNRDYFQNRKTHKIISVYKKNMTGLVASPEIRI